MDVFTRMRQVRAPGGVAHLRVRDDVAMSANLAILDGETVTVDDPELIGAYERGAASKIVLVGHLHMRGQVLVVTREPGEAPHASWYDTSAIRPVDAGA